MLTKEKVKEILEETFGFAVLDEDAQKVFENFVELQNEQAVEHTLAVDDCPRCGGSGQVRNDGFVWVACPICDGVGIATKA